MHSAERHRIEEFNMPMFTQAAIIVATGMSEQIIQKYWGRYEAEMRLSAPAPGRGNRRLYSLADAVFLAAIKSITELGLPPLKAMYTANCIRAWAQMEAGKHFVLRKFVHLPIQYFALCPQLVGYIIRGRSPDAILAKCDDAAVLIVDGSRIVEETNRALVALTERRSPEQNDSAVSQDADAS